MAKTRVALCITDLEVGGAERCLVELATRLDPDRVEPAVYSLQPRPESDEASCVPDLEAAGVKVVCLGTRRRWQGLPAVWRLKRLLREGPTRERGKPEPRSVFLSRPALCRDAEREGGVLLQGDA